MEYQNAAKSRIPKNRYPQQQYEQPAIDTPTYNYEQSYNQNTAAAPQDYQYAEYDQQYSQTNATQEVYEEETYEEEVAQPSLSDYNSHECCVRVTTKT